MHISLGLAQPTLFLLDCIPSAHRNDISAGTRGLMPLDIVDFRDEQGGSVAKLKESQRRRYASTALIDEIVQLDLSWRQMVDKNDNMGKELNKLAKEIGNLMKAKKKEEAEDMKKIVAQVKIDQANMKVELEKTLEERNRKLNLVGNYVHDSVPVSSSEDDNRIITTWGELKRVKNPLHHHQLLYMIDGYNSPQGQVVAGQRGYFLKGVGVMLNQALINYGLTFLQKRGYIPLQPPFFMNKEVMAETAQLEQFDEELYHVKGSEADGTKYLIATSEQPISAYHRKDWLDAKELKGKPIRYAGYSTCFRKEAGSGGRDTWGIFRIHQFEKVEQFCVTSPEESWQEQEKMIEIAAEFYRSLGIAYRVVAIASGALNNAAAKKYDLEAWFPTLATHRELVSCSNCTDYQARAMETRVRTEKADKQKVYVHMLNATLTATERTICCLLENYQTEEGVVVPEVLRPYMNGLELMPFVKPKPVNTAAIKTAKGAEKSAGNKGGNKAANKEGNKEGNKGGSKGGKGK
eukprot:g38365.t1